MKAKNRIIRQRAESIADQYRPLYDEATGKAKEAVLYAATKQLQEQTQCSYEIARRQMRRKLGVDPEPRSWGGKRRRNRG